MLSETPAQQEDLAQIFSLNQKLMEQYEDKSAIDYPKVLAWVRRNLEKELPHFRRVLWQGKPAGFYCLIPGEKSWELDSLFILPQFQNKGIGTEILKRCRASTSLPLVLYVFKENSRAVALYERIGFRVIKNASPTRAIMEWKIPD